MRREHWVGASVNEQKGREERESDSYLYYVAVTKAKKEYGNFSRPCRIYSINIAEEKRFLSGALRVHVASSNRFPAMPDNKDERIENPSTDNNESSRMWNSMFLSLSLLLSLSRSRARARQQ